MVHSLFYATHKVHPVLSTKTFSQLSKTVAKSRWPILGAHHYVGHRRTRPSVNRGTYFWHTLRPVLMVGQVFGLMPLEGVCWSGPRWWKLRWKAASWRQGYTVTVQLGALVMSAFSLATFWSSGVEFAKIMSWMFFTLNLLISVNFSILARRWPSLVNRWAQVEHSLPDQPLLGASYRRIGRNTILASVVLLVSALIEHILSKPAGLHRAYRCPIASLWEAHYRQAFPEMFTFLPYNPYLGFVAQIIATLLTCYWNFVDLFLITVSMALRGTFRHLCQVMERTGKYHQRPAVWGELCVHYRNVVALIRLVNRHIGAFIVISYASNLFFICIQLLNVFQQNSSLIVTTYCWYSLVHLVGRIVAVSLTGSAIHDDYCQLRALFYQLPPECSHIEELPIHGGIFMVLLAFLSFKVQRFRRQVAHDPVVLTGYGFFHLTRELILKIAATVVTYELVLTQVNEAEAKNGDDNPCT